MATSLIVALAIIVVLLLLFWPSSDHISIGEESWTMPGGNPAHTFYLPFAPRGPLKEKWSTRLEAQLAGSPAVAGDRVYVCCDNGYLYCLELDTGRPAWMYDAGSGVTSMPAVFEDGVLLGTVDGRVLAVGPHGDLKWELEVGGAVPSTPIPDKDSVYFGSSDGHLYCVSSLDGSQRWDFDAGSAVEQSPCLFEEQVFAVSYEGDLFALDAADGGLNWTFRSQGIPVVFPAADNGRVFLATEFMIYCSDAQSGKLLWEYSPGPNVISNLAVRGSQLVSVYGVPGGKGEALSLDNRTGDLLWNVNWGEAPQWTWIFASNEDVYVAGPSYLRALKVEDGTPAFDYALQGAIAKTLTVTERYLLVGTANRKVYCLEE